MLASVSPIVIRQTTPTRSLISGPTPKRLRSASSAWYPVIPNPSTSMTSLVRSKASIPSWSASSTLIPGRACSRRRASSARAIVSLEQDLAVQRHLSPGGVDRCQHEHGGTGRLHHADSGAHAVRRRRALPRTFRMRGLGKTAQHLVDRRDRAVDVAGHRGAGKSGVKVEMRTPGFVDVDRDLPRRARRRQYLRDRTRPRSTTG